MAAAKAAGAVAGVAAGVAGVAVAGAAIAVGAGVRLGVGGVEAVAQVEVVCIVCCGGRRILRHQTIPGFNSQEAKFNHFNFKCCVCCVVFILDSEAVVASLEEFIEKGQLECLNEDKASC